MEKRIICLAVSIMIFVFSPAHAFTLFLPEFNTDRPGCDFRNFIVPGANGSNRFQTFAACMNACGLDPNCQAWSFDTGFGTEGSGTCFLKNNICRATPNGHSIAGLKLFPRPTQMSAIESEIDRVGCDFSSFSADNPLFGPGDPQICMFRCAEDNTCQAWNFDARSGTPMCFLKNCVPPPRVPPERPNNVASGVKFSQ